MALAAAMPMSASALSSAASLRGSSEMAAACAASSSSLAAPIRLTGTHRTPSPSAALASLPSTIPLHPLFALLHSPDSYFSTRSTLASPALCARKVSRTHGQGVPRGWAQEPRPHR